MNASPPNTPKDAKQSSLLLSCVSRISRIICLFFCFAAHATQPPVNNIVEMSWQPLDGTNPVDYCIWLTTNSGAKWTPIDTTRATTYAHTSPRPINPTNSFYAITAMPWKPFGVRRESEMAVLHWAPSNPPTNATATVRLKAVRVIPGRAIKISADLKTFDDYLTPRVFDTNGVELTNVLVELNHRTSPAKPKFFVEYFGTTVTNPPAFKAP